MCEYRYLCSSCRQNVAQWFRSSCGNPDCQLVQIIENPLPKAVLAAQTSALRSVSPTNTNILCQSCARGDEKVAVGPGGVADTSHVLSYKSSLSSYNAPSLASSTSPTSYRYPPSPYTSASRTATKQLSEDAMQTVKSPPFHPFVVMSESERSTRRDTRRRTVGSVVPGLDPPFTTRPSPRAHDQSPALPQFGLTPSLAVTHRRSSMTASQPEIRSNRPAESDQHTTSRMGPDPLSFSNPSASSSAIGMALGPPPVFRDEDVQNSESSVASSPDDEERTQSEGSKGGRSFESKPRSFSTERGTPDPEMLRRERLRASTPPMWSLFYQGDDDDDN